MDSSVTFRNPVSLFLSLSLFINASYRAVASSGSARDSRSMKLFARTLTLLTFAFAPSRALQLIGAGAMQAAAAPPRLQHLSLAWCMQAAVAPIAQLCFPLPPAAVWLLEPLLFFLPLRLLRCAEGLAPSASLLRRACLCASPTSEYPSVRSPSTKLITPDQ